MKIHSNYSNARLEIEANRTAARSKAMRRYNGGRVAIEDAHYNAMRRIDRDYDRAIEEIDARFNECPED